MTDTPTPAPSGGTDPRPSMSKYLTAADYNAAMDAWLKRNPRTPPASAPGSGEELTTKNALKLLVLMQAMLQNHGAAKAAGRFTPAHLTPDPTKVSETLGRIHVSLTAAVARARAEGEAKGRREERERCAKVICPGCAEGLAVEFDAKYPSIPMHRYPVAGMEGRTLTSACKARRLAALAEGGGE